MPRPLAILAGLAGLSLTAGCADIMQQSAVSQLAPEWFAEKAVEVKGAGYPELGDIPEVRPFTGSLKEWTSQANDLKTEASTLEAKNTTRQDFRTPEEIRATAAQWRALAEGSSSPPPPEKPRP